MSIAELQLKLHQTIDTISDSKKLMALRMLLKEENAPFERMTLDAYLSAIDESQKQYQEGKTITPDELDKISQGW